MRYLPKSPAERQQMLADIGVKSIDELFGHANPSAYRGHADKTAHQQSCAHGKQHRQRYLGRQEETADAMRSAGAFRTTPGLLKSCVEIGMRRLPGGNRSKDQTG